jgi:hypothetical protein
MSAVPEGYVLVSEAHRRLEKGMFGNLPRPEIIKRIKKSYGRDVSVGLGVQREASGRTLALALCGGDLKLYVCAGVNAPDGAPSDARDTVVLVPCAVVAQLMQSRGTLPDHAIRVPYAAVRSGAMPENVYVALTHGPLVVNETEFESWYENEHGKGKWPSQRARIKRRVGAPIKQTDQLRNAIMVAVDTGRPAGKLKVADLKRRLIETGLSDIPSHDTLARVVDAIYLETGDRRFVRPKRRAAGARFHAKSRAQEYT